MLSNAGNDETNLGRYVHLSRCEIAAHHPVFVGLREEAQLFK